MVEDLGPKFGYLALSAFSESWAACSQIERDSYNHFSHFPILRTSLVEHVSSFPPSLTSASQLNRTADALDFDEHKKNGEISRCWMTKILLILSNPRADLLVTGDMCATAYTRPPTLPPHRMTFHQETSSQVVTSNQRTTAQHRTTSCHVMT